MLPVGFCGPGAKRGAGRPASQNPNSRRRAANAFRRGPVGHQLRVRANNNSAGNLVSGVARGRNENHLGSGPDQIGAAGEQPRSSLHWAVAWTNPSRLAAVRRRIILAVQLVNLVPGAAKATSASQLDRRVFVDG